MVNFSYTCTNYLEKFISDIFVEQVILISGLLFQFQGINNRATGYFT